VIGPETLEDARQLALAIEEILALNGVSDDVAEYEDPPPGPGNRTTNPL
jgi:hypothetical protein